MKTYITMLLCCCFSIFGFSQSITEIAYFYNTDPGFGNATTITANTNTGSITQVLSLPVPANLSGFNTLYMRTKDDADLWSLYDTKIFYILDDVSGNAATNVAAAEYFINTDPGFGNADPISINTNTGTVTQTLSLPINDTNLIGFNTLYIRTQDDVGVWSLYDKKIFYIVDNASGNIATNIEEAEYFINTDPGFGNATNIAIDTNTGEITQTLSLALDSELGGFNALYMRTKDDTGVWSLYDKKLFYIIETGSGDLATNIEEAEYFINTDPGFGNATNIAINTNTGEITQTLSLTLDSDLIGFNVLYMRTKDDAGVWSLYDKRLFYINEDQILSPIVAAEYFYDTDPGFGNGTTATITATGNPDEFTVDLATTDVTCDFHDIYIRLINDKGEWSLYDYRVDIEVYDDANPTIVVNSNITAALDANGEVSIDIDDVNNGTYDDCELVSVVLNQTQFNYTCANLGENTVTVTATDAEDKVSTLDVTITVVDTINPVAISQNITVQLAANGIATFTANDIDNSSTDNCSIASTALNITSFDCDDLGNNTVILTVTDASGNTNSTSATVTVEDNVSPVVVAQNLTIQLDTNGEASLFAADVDNGSSDNCITIDMEVDLTNFDCSNIGDNTVSFTVIDSSGNSDSTTVIITVEDSLVPTVVTQNITVQLDANGTTSITTSNIENGSTDNCTITSSSLNITSFDCSDLGANMVTLSVTDQNNNTGTATATVTVEDNINPVAIARDITIGLDGNGNVTITAAQINSMDDNSTDNCTIVSRSLDITNFTCEDIGFNTVIFTVEDQSGNTNSTTASVRVVDVVQPNVITQDITVELDANGTVSITASDIDNGSTDNCGIDSYFLSDTTFDCSDLGSNNVTLAVTDQYDNNGIGNATVTVEDNINPVAIGQDITIDLNGGTSISITASNVDNGSNDNCDFTLSIDVDTFTTIGEYTVSLTITDSSGNTNTITVTVAVVDGTLSIEKSEILSKSITLYPVPTEQYLNISTSHIIDTIEIYDINGRLINRIVKPNNKIDVSNLSSGVYFLRFITENTFVTKRIIKK